MKKLIIGLLKSTLFVFSIPSVVASQMPGYISYSLMKTLIGAGSGGWSVNVACRNQYQSDCHVHVFSFTVAFTMVLEITGSREEVVTKIL